MRGEGNERWDEGRRASFFASSSLKLSPGLFSQPLLDCIQLPHICDMIVLGPHVISRPNPDNCIEAEPLCYDNEDQVDVNSQLDQFDDCEEDMSKGSLQQGEPKRAGSEASHFFIY